MTDPADAYATRQLDRLRAAVPAPWSPDLEPTLHALARASDFAIDTLLKQPSLVDTFANHGVTPPLVLSRELRSEWPALLRRYRTAESTRLIWRDVAGLDSVDATLAGTTRLAETCLQSALSALEGEFAERFGLVRAPDGSVQRLVVFGLGKLGGGELNFSSDVDLVYAYPHDGESDGARALAAEDHFARLGQQLAKLLDETTADGFSHRVDLRLRPFGSAGRVALPFAAMEQYFQREGRDWERYAWQKARPVAGDIDAGLRFLETLRPFVYRRYLDYGALDGLREMKAAIAAEVARKELADDVKRGPGGIREIEFLVQALQLIRGGREPALRERRLLPAMNALVEAGQIAPETGVALTDAYRFLRRVENRLQMLRDAQTHALPSNELDQQRIARGLGYDDWAALRIALDAHRERVATEFEELLAPRGRSVAPSELATYWRALPDAGETQALIDAGFRDIETLDGSLRDFARAPGVRTLSDATRARLDRVLPALLASAARSSQPDAALRRVLPLLHTLLRRASYLALLDEQPAALARLVDVVSGSALLAERIAAHPLLLDELLDRRATEALPDREALAAACMESLREDDAEAALMVLNEVRQSLSFRIALATLDARQSAQDSARHLAWLADAVVRVVLAVAEREVERAHGRVPDARFAILGYGGLGGEELGFGSDLDLVFLYDAPADAVSDGVRSMDASRWFARLAQKVVALLGTVTGAGRLYDVDVRLRPDGAKGLLVSSLASYAEYQRERAWTWEHQALVRARGIAGDASLLDDFERVRRETLARARDPEVLRGEIVQMRQRMRAELDRSDAARFDLKQGEGGLVDLEFLLQWQVLDHADDDARWLAPRDTPGLLRVGGMDALIEAHAALLDAGLKCTLDRRPRITPETTEIAEARAVIREAVLRSGLRLSPE